MAYPYTQTSVNFNNLVIPYKEYFMVSVISELTVLLLRILRFPEIKTFKMTDDLRWVIHYAYNHHTKELILVSKLCVI
jgi:hypothetical protein